MRNQAALEYECFLAIAHGGRCIVGDQLHPRGMMNLPAYRLIGDVYAQVERRESWCEGSSPLAEIGVVTAAMQENRLKGIPEIDMGALHILEQLKHHVYRF